MKTRFLLLFAICLVCVKSQSQDVEDRYQQALWPIKGKKVGTSIIFKPGDTISEEINTEKLFIGGVKNDTIVSPINGTITSFSYWFNSSLEYSLSNGFDDKEFVGDKKYIVKKKFEEFIIKNNGKRLNCDISKYISLLISIKTNEGDEYFISGLNFAKYFKAGDKIGKGDVIGTMGYAYHAIDVPHIIVSRKTSSNSTDPMSRF